MQSSVRAMLLALSCLLAIPFTAQVDPNKPGGSQAKPSPKPPSPRPGPQRPHGGVDPMNPGGSQLKSPRPGLDKISSSPMIGPGGKAIPPANSSVLADRNGGSIIKSPDGVIIRTNSSGQVLSIKTASGAEAHLDLTGQVTSIRKVGSDNSSTTVFKSPAGVRTVEYTKRDALGRTVRIVSNGSVNYQERDLLRRPGFRQRTYLDQGRSFVRVYQDHFYGKYGAYPVFVPPYYYSSAFYDYLSTPWVAPVTFSWNSYPGYNSYAAYFAPQPRYFSPVAWLTDFIIAENLKAEYVAQKRAAAPSAAANSSSPASQTASQDSILAEVRTAYLQQVEAELKHTETQAEGHPAAEELPGALSPKFRVFQTNSDSEADNNGTPCALTSGDFLRREDDVPDASGKVRVMVVAIAKPSTIHCPLNTTFRLPAKTLQDYYNDFQAALQPGLIYLAARRRTENPSLPDDLQPTTVGDLTPPPPIPAEVKTTYEQEVSAEIAASEGHPSTASVPPALDPKFTIFQAYSDVEADSEGAPCFITGGDFVRREENTPDAKGTVAVLQVTIAFPKPGHCAVSSRIRIPVATLEDWYNSFLAAQQAGFDALSAYQGKNNFPPAADTSKTVNPNGQGTPDDTTALEASIIEAQIRAADAEAEISSKEQKSPM